MIQLIRLLHLCISVYMKRSLISRDSEYFQDIIKLESCPKGGFACLEQIPFINRNLMLALKLAENKNYPHALIAIHESFDTIFSLREEQCQKCVNLFKELIIKSLEQIIRDLKRMTTGLFANKNYKYDLTKAEEMLQELKIL